MMKIRNDQYLRVLGISTLGCVSVLLIRNAVMGNQDYNFLLWNLFLGIVPFAVAWTVSRLASRLADLWIWVGAGLWLLFYPNAPYMITDLIHVQAQSPVVLYDALIIFSLAMLSTFYGFYSMGLVYALICQKYSLRLAQVVIGASILLSSFGIYLGRVLRLNSWDVFTKPLQTLATIWHSLFPVTDNWITYVVIVIFTLLQLMLLSLIIDMDEPADIG